jgi:C4-dicarboxylate transporter DctQ subunit
MKSLLRALGQLEEWILVIVLLSLALLTSAQVICRYVLGFSFIWMDEISRYLGVFIAFLGAAIGVKYGTHFSMDLLYERISSDRFRHMLQVIVNLSCAAIFVMVAYYGWIQATKMWRFGVLTAVLKVPKYWAYLPIPFFSIIMTFRFFSLAMKHLNGLIRGNPFKLTGWN